MYREPIQTRQLGKQKIWPAFGVQNCLTLLTCMPQTLTPNDLLVVLSHFFLWLFFFAGVASIPYCLVPIFRSNTHGFFSFPVRSSIKMKWFWRGDAVPVGDDSGLAGADTG